MKKIVFILAILIPVFFSGCQTDDLFNDNSGKQDNLNGFSLSYHVNDAVSALTKTNVAAEEGEEQINSFYILFFENTTGGTGQFIQAIDAMNDKNMLSTAGTVDVIFPENSKLNKNEEYKMLLCANIKDYLSTTSTFSNVDELNGLCDGKTENEVSNMLLQISGVEPYAADEETDNSNLMPMNNLPMTAKLTKEINKNTYSAELTRAVSRFDVVCNLEDFTLVSASIWNGYTMATAWETGFVNFGQPRTERYYGVGVNENNEIIGSLYALENYVPLTNVQQNDKVSTCLIVGLLRKGRTQVEYFRVNVGVGSRGQELKRNNVYRMTIMNVNSKGDDTEREAYENPERLTDFIVITPDTFAQFTAGGGYTEAISIFASGDWTAEFINPINTSAQFFSVNNDDDDDEGDDDGDGEGKEEKGLDKWTIANGDSFMVFLSQLTNLGAEGEVTVKVYLTNKKTVFETITLKQKELTSENLIVQSTHNYTGSLYRYGRNNTNRYVYHMAKNMRDVSLFGRDGKVQTPAGYVFLEGRHLTNTSVNILQMVRTESEANIKKYVLPWITGANNRFVLMTRRSDAVLGRYEKVIWGNSSSNREYASGDLSYNGENERYFNPELDMSNPLVRYLLENGPFTEVGDEIIPSKLQFRSRNNGRGLTKWPEDKFIPLIMANKNGTIYCVFGIDVERRFIYLGDPGIFGSNYSRNPNYTNFDSAHSDNVKFLNNFIAWLSNGVMYGEDFLKDFR